MKKRIHQILLFFFPNLKHCEECNSLDVRTSYSFTRGWNNWCEQAYGDKGHICNDCLHVTFDKTLEEHKKTLPEWCTPYR